MKPAKVRRKVEEALGIWLEDGDALVLISPGREGLWLITDPEAGPDCSWLGVTVKELVEFAREKLANLSPDEKKTIFGEEPVTPAPFVPPWSSGGTTTVTDTLKDVSVYYQTDQEKMEADHEAARQRRLKSRIPSGLLPIGGTKAQRALLDNIFGIDEVRDELGYLRVEYEKLVRQDEIEDDGYANWSARSTRRRAEGVKERIQEIVNQFTGLPGATGCALGSPGSNFRMSGDDDTDDEEDDDKCDGTD